MSCRVAILDRKWGIVVIVLVQPSPTKPVISHQKFFFLNTQQFKKYNFPWQPYWIWDSSQMRNVFEEWYFQSNQNIMRNFCCRFSILLNILVSFIEDKHVKIEWWKANFTNNNRLRHYQQIGLFPFDVCRW
jgi:hypothetical protein